MASNSDRALFLEHIKENPLTVSEIMDIFNVARNTARSWTKLSEVEHIPGSYPHIFRRRASLAIPGVPSGTTPIRNTQKTGGAVINLPNVPDEQLKGFFEKLMGDEAPPFNFNEDFRAVDSIAAINEVERKLKTCMIITLYYKDLMIKDGVQ